MTVDVIDAIVGIDPEDRLGQLRAKRPIAKSDAQASYEALFTQPSDTVRATPTERYAIGVWVAALSQANVVGLYREGLAALDAGVLAALDAALPGALATGPYGSYPPGPLSEEDEEGLQWAAPAELVAAVGTRLAAALEHAHLLTYRPRDASADALQALLDAGWTADGIVTISQLIAFVHFQLRVVAGLAVLKELN